MSTVDTSQLLIGLPPLVDDRSVVLILGSFPSRLSLAKEEYYGNPQNHFWQIMEALFGIDRRALYALRTAKLLEKRVAVWDVIAECSREGSGDDAIMDATPNSLLSLLRSFPGIGRVAFNGGTALRTARACTPELFGLPGFECERLPSTSPRNARLPLSVKTEAWRRILAWLEKPP